MSSTLLCLPFQKQEKNRINAHISVYAVLLFGADGGGRTHTVSLPRDFESRASANSTTPAKLRLILYNTFFQKAILILKYVAEKYEKFLCILQMHPPLPIIVR